MILLALHIHGRPYEDGLLVRHYFPELPPRFEECRRADDETGT